MGQFIAMMGAPAAGAIAAPAFGSVAAIQAIAAPVATGGFLGLSAGAWSGISTGVSMLSSVRAGQAQQVNYEMQARDAEFAAKDQEIKRRQRLMSSLASQNASRGASGVRAFEGSPAAMMKSDIKEFDYDQSMAAANLGMKQNSLLTSGKYANQSGYISAGSSLLNYGAKRAERG
jgi:phage-related protein